MDAQKIYQSNQIAKKKEVVKADKLNVDKEKIFEVAEILQ